ncbi:Proline iminopeptidase [Fusarium culmorum]|uniref:Proline iminopeptidase n=1 Tax=Fusarium culmorum TaxID=5516 RepID=A0A2T4H029_FUSCU|nr:Proline iminopeptidase [Fusarium culmorum]
MSTPDILSIPSAEIISSKSHILPGQLHVTEFFFKVPLDYTDADSGICTKLFARRVRKHDVPIFPPDDDDNEKKPKYENGEAPKPYMVYLEGGPGFGNREPQDHPLTSHALARGYQLLLLDHRGVGLSSPVSAEVLRQFSPDVQTRANFLGLMRQDNTVRDCEAVRKCLTASWPASKQAWSIFGQSYGGFVSLSYLSMHPEGLREVFLTGGLAPVGKKPDTVYEATFRRVMERNEQYYEKFPEDVENPRRESTVTLRRCPYSPRLLTMGISFGGHGGFDSVHSTILTLKTSLDFFGFFNRASLVPLEGGIPFDTNIIYAILHEAIYCDGPGVASRWSANGVGKSLEAFSWLNSDFSTASNSGPLYFSGEMVFPFHFETYPELQMLREEAELIANREDWPALYDQEKLRKNKVPVYAASYVEDMYVDYDFARDTAKLVKGTKTFETNVMYHSALRAKADEVLHQLFSLRDDVID